MLLACQMQQIAAKDAAGAWSCGTRAQPGMILRWACGKTRGDLVGHRGARCPVLFADQDKDGYGK